MVKNLNRIYLLLFIFVIGILAWIQIQFKPGDMSLTGSDSYPFNEGWTYDNDGIVTEISNDFPRYLPAPGQSEVVLTNTLPEKKIKDMVLVFFSYHQLIKAYIDNKLVYELDSSGDPLGKTPGNVWNLIEINEKDLGKEIRINFQPVYKDLLGFQVGFRIGNRFEVFKTKFVSRIKPFFICVAIFTIGLSSIMRAFILRKKIVNFRKIFYLGLFAIIFALWSSIETGIPQMLINGSVVISDMTYIGLLILPFPMLLFVRETFADERNWMINSTLFLNLIVIGIESGLHLTKISDFRDLLFLTHIVCIYSNMVILWIILHSSKLRHETDHLRIRIYYSSTLIVVVTVLIEIILFYINKTLDNSMALRIVLLIYLLVLNWEADRENLILLEQGIQSEMIKKMAYIDVLTGIRNRTAFNEDTAGIDTTDYSNYRLVMMDLNDLKLVNDTYGHSMGDIYIVRSARLISDTFSKFGLSYRLSGDEFCSVLKNCDEKSFLGCLEEIHLGTEKLNENSKFHYLIACGTAVYDPEQEQDLMGTLKRADIEMYKNKQEQKT